MSIVIEKVQLWRMELQTRLPFKYGIATMTRLPHVFVEVLVRVDGIPARGCAADHLPPKWFTKDPHRDPGEEIVEMEATICRAAKLATGLRATSVFDAWLELHRKMEAWRIERGVPPLLAHFGTSLVERAVIDAFCRMRQIPFHQALRVGAFGLRLGEIHPELTSADSAELLPDRPRDTIHVRQTVGLADPIDAADERVPLNDGLPETLEENIAAYGLSHFKIKFTGAADLPRLERTLETIGRRACSEVCFTVDGNESFPTVAAFREMWAAIEALPQWEAMRGGLLCVEQPLPRAVALAPETAAELRAWSGRPPLIIDESDAEMDSLRIALDAGYIGTSHKNCKGVFRGVANACLLEHRRRTSGAILLQTGEDLANVGPIALLQDLAVQAALGIGSVERNGHHYFRGLDFLPAAAQEAVLEAHPDLYHRHVAGFPALEIRDGRLGLASVNAAPFGTRVWHEFGGFLGVAPIDHRAHRVSNQACCSGEITQYGSPARSGPMPGYSCGRPTSPCREK